MIAISEREQFASGCWELEVEPARGGAVTLLRHYGRDLLVSPDLDRSDAIGTANFVLVPYANRIAHGALVHDGERWTLPRNFDDHVHPLHGVGWLRPWRMDGRGPRDIEMSLRHLPDAAWPWAFTARQRILLHADHVLFEVSVINDAADPAPVGLGFHPAFAAHATTRFRTSVNEVWAIDADSLPVARRPAAEVLTELPGDVSVRRSALVDHCFSGWSRQLRIERAGRDGRIAAIELTASPLLDHLQLYLPPGRDWFCAEPMSQMPDAVHRPGEPGHGGWRRVQPGAMLTAWMRIAVPA